MTFKNNFTSSLEKSDSLAQKKDSISLKQQLQQKEIKQTREETKKHLESLKNQIPYPINGKNSLDTKGIVPQSINNSDVKQHILYKWGNNNITYEEVINTVNILPEPFNTEISDFIKNQDTLGLQKYLNQLIQEGKIIKNELEKSLKNKNIRFNGKILEDGKFGPQTLETIKFILQQEKNLIDNENWPEKNILPYPPFPPEQEKEIINLDWIHHEVSHILADRKNTNHLLNWSKERNTNYTERNCEIDTNNKIIRLGTWGTQINAPCGTFDANNTCEYHRDSGEFYIHTGHNSYLVPFKLPALSLDKNGNPDIQNNQNKEIIRAFTEIGNFLNRTKREAVFNGRYAIEYDNGTLQKTDGIVNDTDLINKETRKEFETKWSHLGVELRGNGGIKIASLLTAAKLDLGKIQRNPDIEKDRAIDPLNDEHKTRVRIYSKTH